jgi:hypothetical protein
LGEAARPLFCLLICPVLALHSSIPREQCPRLHAGYDVSNSVFDRNPESHEDAPLILCQLNTGAEFAAKDLILCAQEIILLREFLLKKFSNRTGMG